MSTCHACGGSGQCQTCNGTGNVKDKNMAPKPWAVDEEGNVECFECKGSTKCPQCNGEGTLDDD